MKPASQSRQHAAESADSQPQPEAQDPKKRKAPKPRHRHGKVARLSKPARDTICRMLEDGAPYKAILEKLGPEAQHISQNNLSEWKRGGFLDWQRENKWLDELRAQQQFALEMLLSSDQNKFPHVVLQIAATQVFQALRQVTPDHLNGKFDSDAASYTRLLNSLSRLSRSALFFTKYEDLRADAKEKELKELDPDRDLNQNECAALARVFDRFFMMPRPELAAQKPAQSPSQAESQSQAEAPAPSTLNHQLSTNQ